MASFRRTLWPNRHDRQSHNDASTESPPSHKLSSNSKYSSLSTTLVMNAIRLWRFLTGVSRRRYTTQRGQWRRALFRCLWFFLLGFLLGVIPFGDMANEDTDIPELSLELQLLHNSSTALLIPENSKGLKEENDLVVDTVPLKVRKGLELNRKVESVPRKQLIVVTPTYNRAFQAYLLNRMGQTLKLVPPPILWIVVETIKASIETTDILSKMGVMYRHLVCKKGSKHAKDRGTHQRNTALKHIELHKLDGIVYFAGDDNIYTLEFFDILRNISRFGTWPVAMLEQNQNKPILEGPVCNGSQVIGWHTSEKSKRLRRFHVHMSGFAFNSTILWDPKRWQRPDSKPIRQWDTLKENFQETKFIEHLIEDESQMEGSPPGCSKLMSWHLHLEADDLVYPRGWVLQKNLKASIPSK